MAIVETTLEEATLEQFEELGYERLGGPEIAPEEPNSERDSLSDVVLKQRLRSVVERINPDIPSSAIDEAMRRILAANLATPSLFENNRQFHQMLVQGVGVEFRRPDGSIEGGRVRLVDFTKPESNDWLVVNQFTVIENKINRRPDIVVFLNGLPIAVIELKSPTDEDATPQTAFNQIQTYKAQIPSLFTFNETIVVSDGAEAKAGTLTGDWEWFLPWKTIDGTKLASEKDLRLEVLVRGMFDKGRLLDLVRNFVVFEVDGSRIAKKMAAYHQFHAVNKAVQSTLEATSIEGDKKVGVVWHTQGSGKSLSMIFYSGKIVRHPQMENPTLVVLTDRNDLDDQLFGTFSSCSDLVRQTPVQAENRAHLHQLLNVASGGVVFTTIQKFMPDNKGDRQPLLSDRSNIVFITDEAHRSQYDFIDGLARHMRDALPNASFIGFTGTPVELDDRNTRNVFGDYIDIYDIHQAVEDGATVPIYYEARLAKIELDESEKPTIDQEFEDVTEDEEGDVREGLKTKWAQLEKVVGSEKRICLIAEDVVRHFEERLTTIDGKGIIVCMSRRICVDLYNALIKLRPDWHSDDDNEGALKIIMTGSASDGAGWQPHIRNKVRRKRLGDRFKDSEHPFKLAIVRDMWLTGFDAPCLHTMYLDKPMRGHGLMQAIARVNRVFRDKPGGLVVDYLGVAESLKRAMRDYTGETTDPPAFSQDEVIPFLIEKYEIVSAMFHGFDYQTPLAGGSTAKINVLNDAANFILEGDPEGSEARDDLKKRYMKAVGDLSKAFALAVPHERAIAIRDEVGFFQGVGVMIRKHETATGKKKTVGELDAAIQQIVSRAISSDEVVDIFSAAGLNKPDISILSDEFLDEVKRLPHRNLAIEALKKLLDEQIKSRSRKNVVMAKSFADMLEKSILRYQNRSIEAAQVIAELIELAKAMREAEKRGEDIGLSEDELAFYDALEVNDSAVQVLGDETLKTIAHELVRTVRENATIDWTEKETARARLRTMVRRVLRKHGYPPDKQEKATLTVLEQATLSASEWAA